MTPAETRQSMKTIAVIDDEYYCRHVLIKYINDYHEEYTIVGEAYNGSDGIRLIDERRPDIVLLDISMPQKDGFAVIQHTLAQERRTRFIIISGYDRFDYAQKAIRLGVEDFLLKPITPQNLYDCLKEVSRKIDASRAVSQTLSALAQKEHRNKSYLASTLLHRLTQENNTSEELEQLAKEIAFPVSSVMFGAAAVHITQQYEALDKKTLDIYSFAVENILNELLAGNNTQCVGAVSGSSILLLFAMQEENAAFFPSLQAAFGQFIATLNRDRLHIIVSIDQPYEMLTELSTSYRNVLSLQQYCIFYSLSGIFDYPSYADTIRIQIPEHLLTAQKLEINRCIRCNNYLGILTGSRAVFDLIRSQKPDPGYIAQQLQIILKDITDLYMEYRITPALVMDIEKLQSCRNLMEIQTTFMELIRALTQAITNPVQPSNHITIVKVRNYIEEHYHEPDLGPRSLSQIFNINEQHLCFLFKKHTDYTIGNYVLKIRMEAAKHLLHHANYNITEISTQVGYKDTGYFSKCFKKYYGISPKHYITKKS